MDVFIGNPTPQHRQFWYRLQEQPESRMLQINAGQQARFPFSVVDEGLDHIIEQLRNSGGREFDDTRSIDSPFVLLYRIGKPIEADNMNEAQALDQDQRQEVAGDMVEAAGMTTFDAASKQRAKGTIESTSLEVVELTDKGDDAAKNGVNFEAVVTKKRGAGKTKKREPKG